MAQPVKTILNGNQEMHPLLSKAQALLTLQHHLASAAPPQFAHSIQVSGLRQGILSIAVSNATIAAKLRQLTPELLTLMQDRGCEVSGIHVKVQVSYDPPRSKPARHKLGQTAQNILNEFSQSLDNSPLKLALNQMIKTARLEEHLPADQNITLQHKQQAKHQQQ